MSTTKIETLKTLAGSHLTRVIGRKPTAHDVDRWEDEISEMAALIPVRIFEGGLEHGLLATVIPEDEYRLEIEDEDWEYEEPEDPGSYPDLEGNEDEFTVKRMEAEHRNKQEDFLKYTAFKQHIQKQFIECIDSTWIENLKRHRTGYAHVTPRQFLDHLRTDVAKLTTRERNELKNRIHIEWNQPEDIETFFKKMEEALYIAEKWDVTIDAQDMLNHAVLQMEDSNLFDSDFMMDWEEKEEHEKTWNLMKVYFTKKYRSIKRYSKGKKTFEQTNNIQQQDAQDISAYFDDFRREAVASNEQIQQMAQSFKGAANTMSEVMDRLKTAMATISTQEKTIANLTNTNKQLIENNSKLAAALAAGGGKVVKETPVVKKEEKTGGAAAGDEDEVKKTNPQGHKCAICYQVHAKPFRQHCLEVETNKNKRPAGWKSCMA